jgi:circadian clock protein KaiB
VGYKVCARRVSAPVSQAKQAGLETALAGRGYYSPAWFARERFREAILARFKLKLYITGASPRAATAIANLRRICEDELRGEYELEIIDVLEHPEAAENDRILATPTLVKNLPPPLRRVIGDLSDKDKVLLGLEVRPVPGKQDK